MIASTENYSIDWCTIEGGGGTSSGGNFSLSGTIGQSDAGLTMSGGGFSLNGGFWSPAALPASGAPRLTILLTSTHTALVHWPSPSLGFTLQQNTNPHTAGWVPVPETMSDDGTNKFVLVSPPTGNRFYRLFRHQDANP